MGDNRQFNQLSGRVNETAQPIIPDTDEEREIIAEEKDDVLEEAGFDAAADPPEGTTDRYAGDPAGEDYETEIARETEAR